MSDFISTYLIRLQLMAIREVKRQKAKFATTATCIACPPFVCC